MAEIGIFEITLLRSLLVAALAVAAALPMRMLLADHRLSVRRAVWVLLLAPYLTPVLLTGYAYANFSLSLIHYPALNVILYSTLLWWKFTPIAAVILHFTPSPISPEAVFCRRLAFIPQNAASRWLFLVRAGCAHGPLAAFAVVFLWAFGEFEMASLMVVKSWTVSLFDAHAGGLALIESLRRMLMPLIFQAVAIATALLVLTRRKVIPVWRISATGTSRRFAWSHLLFAFIFVTAIPAAMILWGTIRGFGLLFQNFVLRREIVTSLLFAGSGTLFAGLLACWSARIYPRFGSTRHVASFISTLSKIILIPALFAGLLGPLVLSLTVLSAVQLPGLILLRDTPLPLIFTLGLVLLPIALVLKLILNLTKKPSALHLVTLMNESPAARDITWRLSTSGKFWAVVLLFVGTYWDLTAPAILAPVGMTPVTVRLYNLMHYGQIAALSAMTCAAFAAPIILFLLAFTTRRWWAPR